MADVTPDRVFCAVLKMLVMGVLALVASHIGVGMMVRSLRKVTHGKEVLPVGAVVVRVSLASCW